MKLNLNIRLHPAMKLFNEVITESAVKHKKYVAALGRLGSTWLWGRCVRGFPAGSVAWWAGRTGLGAMQCLGLTAFFNQ